MTHTFNDPVLAQAAAAGFQVGDYVHVKTRSHFTAAPITGFSQPNGTIMAHWQYGGCVTPLAEIEVSTGHRSLNQFPPHELYALYGDPAAIAQQLTHVGSSLRAEGLTGLIVLNLRSAQATVWVTSSPQPTQACAVYMRVDSATIQSFQASEAAAGACALSAYAGKRYDSEWEQSFPEMVGDLLISLLHHAAALGEFLDLTQLTRQAYQQFEARRATEQASVTVSRNR